MLAGELVYYMPPPELAEDHVEGVPSVVLISIGDYHRIKVLSDKYPAFPRDTVLEVRWADLIPGE